MKKLLLLALVALTFFACSEQEETDSLNAGKTSLSVKIDFSRFSTSTRSGDGLINPLLSDWDYLLLVAKNSGGTEIREKLIAKAAVASTILVFEKEAVNFAGGTVEAYIVTKNNDWGTITALNTANLPVLAAGQTDINNWQQSGFIKAGVNGKFVNVPYYGKGNITDNGPAGDGHHQLVADVTVKPELGRVQVLNTPKIGGVSNGNTVTSLTLKNIYLNRIESKGAIVDIRTLNGNQNVETGGQWITDFYTASKPLAGMTDASTDKGYQIFDGSEPHLIVEVDYQLNSIDKTYTGYLTITKFTYLSVTGGDLTVQKGKIYNIDLAELQPAYDKIGDDPYDDTVYYDLTVTATVEDWSIITVTPEL